jgi:phage-related protein
MAMHGYRQEIHAFQKKSKSGIETPQMEVDLIRDRLKRLKEALK